MKRGLQEQIKDTTKGSSIKTIEVKGLTLLTIYIASRQLEQGQNKTNSGAHEDHGSTRRSRKRDRRDGVEVLD